MLFNIIFTSWEWFVDLWCDLFYCIAQEYGWLSNWCTHFTCLSFQRREELWVNAAWFLILQLGSNISCHSKVRVLVNSLWNQAWDILLVSKYVWESVRERRSCLDCWESDLSTIWTFVYTKNAFKLIERHKFLNFKCVGVKVLDVLSVLKDEGLLWVESKRNNVFDVLFS